jgi:hypothetical protein
MMALAPSSRLMALSPARIVGALRFSMPFTTGGDPRSFHREAGEPVKEGARETRRLARRLRQRARGRGAQVKLAAARRLDELADRVGKIARQIQRRLAPAGRALRSSPRWPRARP